LEIIDLIKLLVNYGIPILALVISIISFIDSKKISKVQSRLSEMEEKLKQYELEEKERERDESTKACVEARVYKISKGEYAMKVWNSGQATAYNVDFSIPDDLKDLVFRHKVPFEMLEPGKSFEEHVVVYMGMPNKFRVKTMWSNNEGNQFKKEQFVTI
jgi:hypothetical protein